MKSKPYISIEQSGLSRRAKNILYKRGFGRTDPLAHVSDASLEELETINGAGNKTLQEIEQTLAKHGFALRNEGNYESNTN